MKKVLVPTDFSAEADYALEVATIIATKTGADIELLHVVEDVPQYTFSTAGDYVPQDSMDRLFVKKLIERAHEQLLLRIPYTEDAGVTFSHKVKVGNVVRHIGESVADEKVDLIVMGTKGASGLHEILVGSNTEKVVRLAKCPVLSVLEKPHTFNLKNVVLAMNFEENYTPLLDKLNIWQIIFGFTLHIVHVNTPLNFDTTASIEEKMNTFGKEYHLQNYTFTVVNEYTYEEGIMGFARKKDADMIVMLTHGRKGISLFLDGSVTSSVVNHSNIPVMSYRIND